MRFRVPQTLPETQPPTHPCQPTHSLTHSHSQSLTITHNHSQSLTFTHSHSSVLMIDTPLLISHFVCCRFVGRHNTRRRRRTAATSGPCLTEARVVYYSVVVAERRSPRDSVQCTVSKDNNEDIQRQPTDELRQLSDLRTTIQTIQPATTLCTRGNIATNLMAAGGSGGLFA